MRYFTLFPTIQPRPPAAAAVAHMVRTCTHNAHARRNAHARAHTEITNKRKQQRD